MRSWWWLVGHKKASKPSKCINPCQRTLQKLCTFGSSQVTQRFRFVMVRQVFPERTIYQESQLATSARDMCPSRRPMRLGARHRRLLDTDGRKRPLCRGGARVGPPPFHHVKTMGSARPPSSSLSKRNFAQRATETTILRAPKWNNKQPRGRPERQPLCVTRTN